jgi:hypothetical protein
MISPTEYSMIDPYLASVTALEPRGDVAAEVAAAVESMLVAKDKAKNETSSAEDHAVSSGRAVEERRDSSSATKRGRTKKAVPASDRHGRKRIRIDGQWTCIGNYKDVGTEHFIISLSTEGDNVRGKARCVSGPDEGVEYRINGVFHNLILSAVWTCSDCTRIEAGTVCLMLTDNGKTLEGFNTYYDSKARKLDWTEQCWTRQVIEET